MIGLLLILLSVFRKENYLKFFSLIRRTSPSNSLSTTNHDITFNLASLSICILLVLVLFAFVLFIYVLLSKFYKLVFPNKLIDDSLGETKWNDLDIKDYISIILFTIIILSFGDNILKNIIITILRNFQSLLLRGAEQTQGREVLFSIMIVLGIIAGGTFLLYNTLKSFDEYNLSIPPPTVPGL